MTLRKIFKAVPHSGQTPSPTAEGQKPKLVQFNCPEEMVKKEAGDLEVTALDESQVGVAEKVLQAVGAQSDSLLD